jgi:hypothetical protein
MHNGALADPLNKFSKASKLITSKRQKTDADLEEMARLEFLGGLYVNDKGLPIIPSEVLEATIVNGAKAEKLGKLFKSSVFVNDHSVLDYDGSADINELWKDEKFRLVAGVKIGTARIMRTRPKFDKWSCAVQVDYLDESINEEMIIRAITKAGILVGIGDWRPKFGRFTVEKL